MRPILIVGIAGGTGSGKSTLVQLLLQSDIGREITVLQHDHYYFSANHIPPELRQAQNWDHPDAIDNALYIEHLNALAAGHDIECPNYNFETHCRKTETTPLSPKAILLVEGILVFAVPKICQRLDLRIFVETSSDERIIRRMLRDTRERGRSLDSVVQQYRSTVKPMHDKFIQPSRDEAHLVLPNAKSDSLQKGAELICGFLKSQLGRVG